MFDNIRSSGIWEYKIFKNQILQKQNFLGSFLKYSMPKYLHLIFKKRSWLSNALVASLSLRKILFDEI